MAELGFWLSWGAGMFLLAMCVLGALTFVSRARWGTTPASRMLALAILVGMFAAGLNTFYWQVFGQMAVARGVIDVPTLRAVGNYLDVIFKGGAGLAVWMHLKALWLALPAEERGRWSILGMVRYPDDTSMLSRLLNGFR